MVIRQNSDTSKLKSRRDMKNSSEFIEKDTQPWEDLGNGMKRQMMGYDENIMMVKVAFDKGAIGQLHEHYHSQTTYVVSGKFEVEISGKKKILSEGDGFYIPPHIMHGAVCLEPGILIDVFSPHREDFLEKK